MTEIKSIENLLSEKYTLNFGPQHPSTHGVLRMVVEMDGETCVKADARIGYLHRGMEKLLESRTYLQGLMYTDRLDYLAGVNNNLPYVLAVEKLLGIEVPERATLLRMLTCEIMRLASYMVGIGVYIMDSGAVSGVFYPFQQREYALEAMSALCGARMTQGYIRYGGVQADLNDEFDAPLQKLLDEADKFLNMYHKLVDENEIFVHRTKGVGVITAEQAKAYALTGPNLRASGVAYDLRKHAPYMLYDRFDFKVPTMQNGDCYDRYMQRMLELEEIYKLIKEIYAALKECEGGEIMAKIPKVLRPAAGEAYAQTENPKGIMGCMVASDGKLNPLRVHFRRPSYDNIAIFEEIMPGHKVADLVVIIASFDIVLGEIDG
jgi:NADH-quinone oxidoreductase subunit D